MVEVCIHSPAGHLQEAIPSERVRQVELFRQGLWTGPQGSWGRLQKGPLKKGGQVQENSPGTSDSWHRAPFRQGPESHSFTSSPQSTPVQPGEQKHLGNTRWRTIILKSNLTPSSIWTSSNGNQLSLGKCAKNNRAKQQHSGRLQANHPLFIFPFKRCKGNIFPRAVIRMNAPVGVLAHAPWSLCRTTKSFTGQLNHRSEHLCYPRQADVGRLEQACWGLNGNVCMPDGERKGDGNGEMKRERKMVHTCLNCLLLRRANIPLGGSEHPSTTNPSALFSLSSPNFSTWSGFHVSRAKKEEGEAFADAYTQAFFSLQWVTHPLEPFHAVSHWLTHLFHLPSAIHYLCRHWKGILLLFSHLLSDGCADVDTGGALQPALAPTCSRREGRRRWRCFCRDATNIHQFLVGRTRPPTQGDKHTHNSGKQ